MRTAQALRTWLPIAVAATFLGLLIAGTVQQNYRMSANDPQIQLAEDTAARLSAGAKPAVVVAHVPHVEIARSLAPWVAVYDAAEKPLASSGTLDGAPPAFPAGVLAAAKAHGENRITWQPHLGVRAALIVVPYGQAAGGFVASGRSLREVEVRTNDLSGDVLIGWFVTLVASFVAAWLVARPEPVSAPHD